MDDSAHHSEIKSHIAQEKPRDEHGHFVHPENSQPDASSQQHLNPISQFLHDETSIHKTDKDELIDVHVGNPFKRITDLLEEIKKQKAFSFSLKGSLGLAGIVLVLGAFGIFGGTKALCSKGVQSEVGVLKVLSATEVPEETFIDRVLMLLHVPNPKLTQRMVLLTPQNNLIHIVVDNSISNISNYTNQTVITTGEYDSCSLTQKIERPEFIEFFLQQ